MVNNKNKFDNNVYFTICEISLGLFGGTNYATYGGYCNGMKTAILTNGFSKKQKKDLISILDRMELLYSLDYTANSEYITDFFCEDMYLKFEKSVRLTIEVFGKALN